MKHDETNILHRSKDLKVLHEFLHVLCNLWPKSSKKSVEPILTCAFWMFARMCQDFNKMLSRFRRFQMLLEHKMPKRRRCPRLERFNRSCALCLISAPEPVLNRCMQKWKPQWDEPVKSAEHIYIMCIYIIYGQYHLLIYLFILL